MEQTLTKRQSDLAQWLLKENGFLTCAALAARFGVSQRTIRSDMAAVAAAIQAAGGRLEHHPVKGYLLHGGPELAGLLSDAGPSDVILDRDQRRQLAMMLILGRDSTTYEQLAADCGCSKQTAVTDMKDIAARLRRQGLAVSRKPGRGLAVQGPEGMIRDAFAAAMAADATQAATRRADALLGLAGHRREADRLFDQVQAGLHLALADEDRIRMMLRFTLARRAAGHVLTDQGAKAVKTNTGAVPPVLRDMDLNAAETRYFNHLFLRARLLEPAQKVADRHVSVEARQLAVYLFDQLQKLQPVAADRQDGFVTGLTQHLNAALYRVRHGIRITNQMQSEIMLNIPLLYEFTKEQLGHWEERFGIEFDDGETAYIAMYIASAYETSVRDVTTLTVLLMCTFGITTSAILRSRLFSAIPECRLVGPMSMAEADAYLADHQVDMVISTAPYANQQAPVVIVNPLLCQDDIDDIKNRLAQLSYAKMCSHFISAYSHLAANPAPSRPLRVADIVPAGRICIMDGIDGWEQAIQQAARPLLEDGLVEPRYVARMIEAVKQFGTYMVLVDGVAFVHAGVDDGIAANCTAMLLLRRPVTFGDRNPKPVCAIVIIGIKDKREDVLLKLVYIFGAQANRRLLQKGDFKMADIMSMTEGGTTMEKIALKDIRVGVTAGDWRQAIRQAGQLLVDDGRITAAYVDAMIRSVETLGPYMVLMPGFALAHAAPSAAVKSNGLSLITLAKPVRFGCDNDPVKVVMCLACTDRQSHIDTLQDVAKKLMAEGIVGRMAACPDAESLYRLIN